MFLPFLYFQDSLRAAEEAALRCWGIVRGTRVGLAGALLRNVQARPTRQRRDASKKTSAHLGHAEDAMREPTPCLNAL